MEQLNKVKKREKMLSKALFIIGVILLLGGMLSWPIAPMLIDKVMVIIIMGAGLLTIILGKSSENDG